MLLHYVTLTIKRHKSVKEENKNFKFEGLHCELEMKKELKKQQFTKNFASEVSVSERYIDNVKSLILICVVALCSTMLPYLGS